MAAVHVQLPPATGVFTVPGFEFPPRQSKNALVAHETSGYESYSTPLMGSIPGSLTHVNQGVPTEVEYLLEQLGYLPSVVKLVAQYRITTREDLLRHMKIEASKIKWELGMHKVPFRQSRHAPAKESIRSPRHHDAPAASFIDLLERSKQLWPERRPRKQSMEDMLSEIPRAYGQDSQDMETRVKAFMDRLPPRPGFSHQSRSFSDTDLMSKSPSPSKDACTELEYIDEIPLLDPPPPLDEHLPTDDEVDEGDDEGEDDDSVLEFELSPPKHKHIAPRSSLRDRFQTNPAYGALKLQLDTSPSTLFPIGKIDDFAELPGRRKRLPSVMVPPQLRKSTSTAT